MAMPISNTHLRVPRGFGALLEGLTREILRDQPKYIPKYAAEYFETLLKQREERGIDPSEWAAKLEDRYYNNHSFKPSDHASRKIVSYKITQDSLAEDYSGHSEEDALVTMKAKHFTAGEEEQSPIQTQVESANGPPVTSPDPTASTQADGLANEINNSAASNQNNSESESHEAQLLRETENTETQKSDTEGKDDDVQEHTEQAGNVNISSTYLEEETADAASEEEEAEQKDTECSKENQQSMNNELKLNLKLMEQTDKISNEKEDELKDDDNEENISNHDHSKDDQFTSKADNLLGEDTTKIHNDEKYDLNVGEVYQEIEHQKSVDNDPASDFAESNVKISEEHGEIQEKVEDDLSEEEDQYQEETLEKYFTAPQDQHSEEEELEGEGLSDSEVKEGHSSHNQENVNPDLDEWPNKEDSGLQEEQQDTLEPERQIEDKQEECSRPQEEEDIMDIPLDDPEANRAAAKIQAGFRGHMTRKKMKPEDKTEGEEVSSSGDVLNGRQGGTEAGGSRPVGSDVKSVPKQ